MRLLLLLALACSLPACRTTRPATRERARPFSPPPDASLCDQGKPLKVHFFDVAQALSVLVELPGGETILVDVGESPKRPGCGSTCSSAHDHLVSRLTQLLHEQPISLVWITHQHSDHLGGAEGVFGAVKAKLLVDNGLDGETKQVEALHDSATKGGAEYRKVTPARRGIPLAVAAPVTLTAVLPSEWPKSCAKDKNDCSIGLRIDYCASSILFAGDAEADEEGALDVGPVTLLQAGHHGSDTSSSADFIGKLKPKYVVISSGKAGEGMNKGYCHPRMSTVERLSSAVGGTGGPPLNAFDASVSCKEATPANWKSVPTSANLFSTARDGDVTLVTTGDGVFSREPTVSPPPL